MWKRKKSTGNYVLPTTNGNIVIRGELLGDVPVEKMNAVCTAYYKKSEKSGMAVANDEGTVFVGWLDENEQATDDFKTFEVNVTRQKPSVKADIKINIRDLD